MFISVNVTKNFKAMEMHERDIERQNFINVRKLSMLLKRVPTIKKCNINNELFRSC